jgi:hypothetical protein
MRDNLALFGPSIDAGAVPMRASMAANTPNANIRYRQIKPDTKDGFVGESKWLADNGYMDDMNSLTGDQWKAMHEYQKSSSAMNEYLRGLLPPNITEADLDELMLKRMPVMDEVFKNKKIRHNLIGYRGIDGDTYTKLRNNIGSVMDDKGFMSVSLDPNEALEFSNLLYPGMKKGGILEIRMPEGSSGIYLGGSPYGNAKREAEMLLKRNTRFAVKGLGKVEIDGEIYEKLMIDILPDKTVIMKASITPKQAAYLERIRLQKIETLTKKIDDKMAHVAKMKAGHSKNEMMAKVERMRNERNALIKGGAAPEAIAKVAKETAEEVAKFVPAKTIEEAKAFARKEFGIKAPNKLKVTNLESLNAINEEWYLLKQEGYAFNYQYYTDAVGVALDKTSRAYASSSDTLIYLNERWFNDTVSLKSHLRKDVKVGFHPAGTSHAKSVVVHEYSHSLSIRDLAQDTAIKREFEAVYYDYLKETGELRRKYKVAKDRGLTNSVMFDDGKEIGPVGRSKRRSEFLREKAKIFVSEYAEADIDEFVAECFAMYRHSTKKSPFAIKVGRLIDKYYKKGGPK